MNGSAVRTNQAGNLAAQFHVRQNALKIARRQGADQCLAFVATYLGLISVNRQKNSRNIRDLRSPQVE